LSKFKVQTNIGVGIVLVPTR